MAAPSQRCCGLRTGNGGESRWNRLLALATICALVAALTGAVHAEDCKFDADGRTFDFSDLRGGTSSYYEVNNERLQVEADVTLCQGLASIQGCKNAVVCIRDLDGSNPRPAGDPSQETFELVDPNDPDFGSRLIYPPADDQDLGVHLVFTCGVGVGEPVLMEEFDTDSSKHGYSYYVFQWATDEMCTDAPPARQENCQASYRSVEYDLSPLVRNHHNWEAVDVLENNRFHYDINVCRSLVITDALKGTSCETHEGTSVCKSTRHADGSLSDSTSLGWSAKPIFRAGKLSIETSFGDKCDAGFKSDAIIDFICDVNAGSGHPTLREVTDQCVYIFNWRSSVACPVQEETGEHCRVYDSATGTVYDLSSLNRNKSPYTIETDDYTYKFNVCGDISSGNCVGKGVCQVDKATDKIYDLGTANTKLEYERESLTLEYLHGAVCGGTNRKTVITFRCTDGADKYEVVESTACVYEIEFFTNAACGLDTDLLECVVTDEKTGEQYDLSSLTRTKGSNWRVAKDSHTADEIELNVCAPLVFSTDTVACPADAAVCGLQGIPHRSKNAHFGVPADPVIKDGILTIEYPAQDGVCGNTTLLLHCSDTQEAPRHLRTSKDGCHVTLQWDTPAACPVNAASGQHCTVTDPDTENTFNLNALAGTTRKVAGNEEDTTYYVSLCSPLDSSATCAHGSNGACVENSGESHGIGQANDVLHVVDGTLYAKYSLGMSCDQANGLSSTVILFECDPSYDGTEDNALYFNRRDTDSCQFEFVWRTRLACAAASFECIVEDDNGNVYDLSPLSKARSNWLASGDDNSFYEINVCRTINDNVGTACLQSRDAACQRTPSRSYSLGKPSAPKWDADRKHVYLEYEGGAKCDQTGKPRRTRINFICDKNERPGTLVFDGETRLCEYEFTWATEAACPITTVSDLGCAVVDPLTDTLYNLTRLLHPSGYQVQGDIGTDEYTFLINVCQPLAKQPCGDDDASAACQILGDNEWSLGSLSKTGFQSPTFDAASGKVFIEYLGGDVCESSGNIRRTRIEFQCDNTVDVGMPEFKTESSECEYEFVWKTRYACPLTEQSAACKLDAIVNNKVVKFDLAPLIHNKRNWLVDTTDADTEDTYQINVCRPLVPQGHSCAPNMGACRVSNSFWRKDVNYGHAGLPALDEDDHLVLMFDDGAACGNNTDLSHSVVVEMVCPRRDDDGSAIPGIVDAPYYVDTSEECVTHMEWTTSYACPLSTFKGTNCHITDIVTGQYYDLSALTSKTGYSVTAADGKTIDFNICGAPNACSSGSGACVGTESYGQVSESLSFDEGALALVYKGGAKCGGTERTTRLEMVCDPERKSSPKIELGDSGDDTCNALIYVHTALACHKGEEVECLARDPDTGVEYDLSPLRNPVDNYYAGDPREGSKYTYAINVCRNLVPLRDYPDCDPESSVCQISHSNGRFLERNLGDVAGPRFEEGQLFIEYANGDLCGNTPRRTRIYFECGTSVGEPVFVQEHSCYYIFNWRTSAACAPGQSDKQDSSSCQVTDEVTSAYFDLRPLKGSPVTASNPLGKEIMQVSVCNDMRCGSGKAGVCLGGSVNLGHANTEPSIAGGSARLLYTDGDKCGVEDKRYSSEIIFVCDFWADGSKPQLFFQDKTDECHYVFKWYTRDACEQQTAMSCVIRDFFTSETYDLSPLTRRKGETNWKAIDTRDNQNYEYEINVCHNLIRPVDNDPNDKCRGSAACQTKPGDASFPNYPLGRLDAPPSLVRGEVQLTYTMDGLPTDNCGSNRRRATITFTCLPGTLGSPVFDYEDETCHYFFIWETSAACSTRKTVGSNCAVQDPVSLLSFDLSHWAEGADILELEIEEGTLQVAACGPVPDCGGAGACVTAKNGKKHSAGQASRALTYADNELRLTYDGGEPCAADRSQNLTTFITFVCPDDVQDNSTMYRFYDCGLYVTWPAERACRRRREAACVVTDPETGAAYDLSPLEKPPASQTNWIVDVKEDNHRFEYILNVCHSLNEQVPSTGCDATAGVCQIDDDIRYNLGGVTSPSIENGSLVLEYTNGDNKQCPQGKYRRTKIVFFCDEDAGLGHPDYVEEHEDLCQYLFHWRTSAACPVRGPSVGDSCAVEDPVSGMMFDLADVNDDMLEGQDGRAKYFFSLCSALDEPCDGDEESGLCMQKDGAGDVSLGKANGNLMVREGLVYLVYHNGSDCPYSAHTPYTAEVRFVCRPCEPDELVPESTQGVCRTSFTYYTANLALCGDNDGNCTAAHKGSKSANAGAVAAGVLVPLILIAGGAAFYFLYWRRRQSRVAFMPMSVANTQFGEDDDFEDAEDDDPLSL